MLQLRKIDLLMLAAVLAVGVFLRLPANLFREGAPLHFVAAIHPAPAFNQTGFDEGLYAEYVTKLDQLGLSSYPLIVQDYVERQERLQRSILSPLRFLYIFCGYLWHHSFGTDPLDGLKDVASLFSILTLAISIHFVRRLAGASWAIGVGALMAVAPTQLHMSQHAMVDGFFTFWALLCLWLLWENLQNPGRWQWIVAYIAALALLILTKENAFFVGVAIVILLIANRWLQFGKVSRELLIGTVLGPLVGAVVLILLAGGISETIHTYRFSIEKNYALYYAILTGDGPWQRYFIDLLLVSPVVLLLAFGTAFRLNRPMKAEWFMAIFIAASYLVMCNVKYGMNLRYANMWDLPLRFLAFSQIAWFASFTKQFRGAIIAIAVALLAAIEFHQYIVLAVRYPLYELVPIDLLRALHILKFQSDLPH